MHLSKRMAAVAELVTQGGCVADIGTDHGYVPIFLVQSGKVCSAIAMDVGEGPLMRAKEHILAEGLTDKIKTRLSDGLSGLNEGEAQSVIMAGMGGLLMMRILKDGEKVLTSVEELILQPQSEIDTLRDYLQDHDFRITHENMIFEDGKYYAMMRVVHGQMKNYDAVEKYFGRLLIEEKHPILKDYLAWELEQTETIIENLRLQNSVRCQKRLEEMLDKKKLIITAQERMS